MLENISLTTSIILSPGNIPPSIRPQQLPLDPIILQRNRHILQRYNTLLNVLLTRCLLQLFVVLVEVFC